MSFLSNNSFVLMTLAVDAHISSGKYSWCWPHPFKRGINLENYFTEQLLQIVQRNDDTGEHASTPDNPLFRDTVPGIAQDHKKYGTS